MRGNFLSAIKLSGREETHNQYCITWRESCRLFCWFQYHSLWRTVSAAFDVPFPFKKKEHKKATRACHRTHRLMHKLLSSRWFFILFYFISIVIRSRAMLLTLPSIWSIFSVQTPSYKNAPDRMCCYWSWHATRNETRRREKKTWNSFLCWIVKGSESSAMKNLSTMARN